MMNLRIPLSVFVLASVIGLMAVTAIAAMSMQKAYSSERWCFKESGQERCFSSIHICNQERDTLLLNPQHKVDVTSGCEKQ